MLIHAGHLYAAAPVDIKALFAEIAHQQRGDPETAMYEFQEFAGWGLTSFMAEHLGDLIHRMTEPKTFDAAGYATVKDKVEKTLDRAYPSGLHDGVIRQLFQRADEVGVKRNEFVNEAYAMLDRYAAEHEKLPTYNQAQELANLAAVSFGRRKYQETYSALQQLHDLLQDRATWIEAAHQLGPAATVEPSIDDSTIEHSVIDRQTQEIMDLF